MKKRFLLLFSVGLLLSGFSLSAQQVEKNDPVIFEINGEKIHQSEFMKEFLRSIGQSPNAAPTACTYEKRKALEDYVDLFVNFRAKLADAYSRGMDTMPALVKELSSYRKELAAPYLIDSATRDRILREAYDRNHYALHAAHILVRLGKTPSPEDTLKAYQEAMSVYNRVMAGEDFYKVAAEMVEKQLTDDQRQYPRPTNPQEGDLGCFTVFDMVYPFENAVYALQPGEISKPVRSRYGYHIIKLMDKVEYFGKTTLQHIWLRSEVNERQSESQIRMAYQQLLNGDDFSAVVRGYSHDRSTPDGTIADASFSQIPYDFVLQLARLKEGEFSEPFKSPYGWHIVKLVKREYIPSFEEMIPYYKQRLSRDQRNNEPQSIFVEHAKQKYAFVDYTQEYGTLSAQNGDWTFKKAKKVTKKTPKASSLAAAVGALSDSVYACRWIYNDSLISDDRPLFVLDGKNYNTRDFCKYIAMNQKLTFPCGLDKYVEKRYGDYVADCVLRYADSQIEVENPEFRDLIEEYRHGLMIFSYNDDMVWTKSLTDSAGFADFYASESVKHNYDNPDDSIYFWNTRARVSIVSVSDSGAVAPEKVQKLIQKGLKKGWSSSELKVRIQKKMDKHAAANVVNIKSDLLEEGHQNLLTNSEWKTGVYPRSDEKGYSFIIVEQILNPTLKSKNEARGYYINDYQNALEKKLVERLRSQYRVVIHQSVVDEITY